MIIENSNIKNLFITISDNKVILIKSGLEEFVKQMKKIDSNVKSKTYYDNHFRTSDVYYFQNPTSGKQYIFQKVINLYKK